MAPCTHPNIATGKPYPFFGSVSRDENRAAHEKEGEWRTEQRYQNGLAQAQRERDEIKRRINLFEEATGIEIRGWCDDARLRAIAATAQHLRGRTQSDLDRMVARLTDAAAALAKHAAEIRQATEALKGDDEPTKPSGPAAPTETPP